MPVSKEDIIARLRREILPLQGFKTLLTLPEEGIDLGPVLDSFPGKKFPTGCLHEFLFDEEKDKAPTTAFIAGIAAGMLKPGGVGLWVSHRSTLFPPALVQFGINPAQLIFLDVPSVKDIDWVTEEALSCEGITAVIAENRDLAFTQSRRFQLAVEKSQATCFYIRKTPSKLNITASISRWKIHSIPSRPVEELPGVGFPLFSVSLLKARNGRPGQWEIEWRNGQFQVLTPAKEIIQILQKKTG